MIIGPAKKKTHPHQQISIFILFYGCGNTAHYQYPHCAHDNDT